MSNIIPFPNPNRNNSTQTEEDRRNKREINWQNFLEWERSIIEAEQLQESKNTNSEPYFDDPPHIHDKELTEEIIAELKQEERIARKETMRDNESFEDIMNNELELTPEEWEALQTFGKNN